MLSVLSVPSAVARADPSRLGMAEASLTADAGLRHALSLMENCVIMMVSTVGSSMTNACHLQFNNSLPTL